MIYVEHISKSFGEQQVLNDISVTFEEGKISLIIGASGSGKTVLLKTIAGLHEVSSGTVKYDNVNFSALDAQGRKEIHQQTGMLFQGAALFDFATVEENVRFPLDFFTQWTEAQKRERVDFCLNRVRLHNAHDKFPSELSGGMQKRVGIARAIVMNPKYLFCDEPNSGLDPQTSIVIDELIRDITHEFHMTTIVNTHDMNSVLANGEKVVFIYKGNLAWEGTNQEIFQSGCSELDDFVFASKLAAQIRKRTPTSTLN